MVSAISRANSWGGSNEVESIEPGFVERLRIDLRFGLGEEFVVVLPENRALRGNGFEAVTVQMVCDFTGKLVEAVEVGVELVVAVGRPDETTVTKPLEDTVDRVAVVVAPVSDPETVRGWSR